LQVWRLVRRPYADAALTGIGSFQRGTRWSGRGVHVVFAAESRSLAILEVLAHIDKDHVPRDYTFLPLDIPDEAIEVLDLSVVPSNWRTSPPPTELQAIGNAWARELRSLALRVPSVIVPEESNVLINPHHPRFSEITQGDSLSATIDERLL
jgi:RES domain-containing protein